MTKARTLADNFAADINGITAGTGITGGGTSGTVTVTNSMATAIDAKGDLVVGTGADTFSRLAVASTAGYLLSVDSGETTGLKWAAPAAGALVHLNTTLYSSSSGFNVDNVFSATYANYVIYIHNIGSASGDLRMLFRVGGSTDSSTNYNTQTLNADNTTVSGTRETAQTSTIVGKTNTVYTIQKIDLQQPFATLPTGHTTQCQNNIEGAPEMRHHFGNFQNSTSFTGFRLAGSTGTISGTVYTFGVKQ